MKLRVEAQIPGGGGPADGCSDLDLAARVAGSDEAAFEVFYRMFAARLYSMALRLSRSPSTAEDMTQDAFMHLSDKMCRYTGQAPLVAWVLRVSANRFISYLRSQRFLRKESDLDRAEPARGSAGDQRPDPEKRLVNKMDLETAVASLPDGYRQVVVLHDVEGFQHNEIAEMLGIAEGTSKSQLHHARMRLRGYLSGGEP